MKHCNCCHADYTLEQFFALPTPPAGDTQNDGFELHTLRNCRCGSTIAVTVLSWIDAKEQLIAERELDDAA